MPGRPRKVSFVLQFVSTSDPKVQEAAWRGALQEVESGQRHGVTSLDGLGQGLAAHGVTLPRDEDTNTAPRPEGSE